jgi:hypothetical protein
VAVFSGLPLPDDALCSEVHFDRQDAGAAGDDQNFIGIAWIGRQAVAAHRQLCRALRRSFHVNGYGHMFAS